MFELSKYFAVKKLFLFSILLFAATAHSQSKTLEQVRNELATLQNSELFSAAYKEGKDLTIVKLSIDLRSENPILKKKFKEFGVEVESVYVGPSIDEKPFRSQLCVKTRAKRFHFARNNALTITLDSGPVDFPPANRSSQLKGRKARESLCWDVNKSLLSELGATQTFIFEVGSEKIEFGTNHIKLFAEYSKLIKVD